MGEQARLADTNRVPISSQEQVVENAARSRKKIRALRLRAKGYSYRDICELTGWTYTFL